MKNLKAFYTFPDQILCGVKQLSSEQLPSFVWAGDVEF